MREEHEFHDWTPDWTPEQDDRLRESLGSLRADVDAAGIPDVRFVLRRAGRQRHRAVVGIAAGAAAVVGLSWFGYQVGLDETPSTAPAGQTSPSERERAQQTATEHPSQETDPETTEGEEGAALVQAEDLVLAESGGPELALFVPPTQWASEAFTGGAATQAGTGDFESTALFVCDPDDVMWGAADEGTFGLMTIWSQGSAFGAQRVRVLESADAAAGYVNDLQTALATCQPPAEADNISLDVEPLELSGAYRVTTSFADGTDPITDFYLIRQHQGTPEAVSTYRLTDQSGRVTDAQAASELERLAGLVMAN